MRVRGQLREAYALLRLAEKKIKTYPGGQNACDVNTGRDQYKKLLGNPTAKHLFSIFSKKKKKTWPLLTSVYWNLLSYHREKQKHSVD